MKICKSCNKTYDNPNLRFCGVDGSVLSEIAASAPAPVQPVQQAKWQSPPAPPSLIQEITPPSLLMLFFANQFVPTAGMLGDGVMVPCQNVKVKAGELVNEMMSAAFWQLRERGLISMQLGKPEGWIFKSTPVNLQVVKSEQLTGGLEHDFFKLIEARRTVTSAKQIIIDHLSIESKYPHWQILGRMTQWVLHLQFGNSAQKQGFFNQSELNFESDCARISQLNGAAHELNARWQQFKNQESALYSALIKECQAAISARTERDTDNDYHTSYD